MCRSGDRGGNLSPVSGQSGAPYRDFQKFFGQFISHIRSKRGVSPGEESKINSTNLTYSTANDTPQGLVDDDLASGASGASGEFKKSLFGQLCRWSAVREQAVGSHAISERSVSTSEW